LPSIDLLKKTRRTPDVWVPNPITGVVRLRAILNSAKWKKTTANLPIALGCDLAGNVIIDDLANMQSLLIAGMSGSGKAVCMNTILASLFFRFTPDDLRLVLVDSAAGDMQPYKRAPHLLAPIITDAEKAVHALHWCINELEKRFMILAKADVRNIAAFNNRPKLAKESSLPSVTTQKPTEIDAAGIPDRLPYIVIVIDELADLMGVPGYVAENSIVRLTGLASYVGIHMVLATQRPSKDVITGVIKANIRARIAFRLGSKQDSRIVLDGCGAEKLLGRGDMLYRSYYSSKPVHAQGALVSDQEVQRLVEFTTKQRAQQFILSLGDQVDV
jgi:S-DNA-T family DNA segregation ATPase FtsK/SpoIIIE